MPPNLTAPGVYVSEVASAVRPIVGVGTSTAAFIGVVPDQLTVPAPNPKFDPTKPLGFTQAVTVTITGSPIGGSFTLSFQGAKAGAQPETATIKHDATAADVQEKLEALSSIGSGNVIVGSGPGPTSFTVTFTDALGGKDIVSLTAASDFTDRKPPDLDVNPPGPTKAVTVTITGSPTGGNFTLSFQKKAEDPPEKTATIKHDATAADVQEQLEALRSIGSGNVDVGGGPGPNTPFTVTLTGELRDKDIVSLTAEHKFTDGKPSKVDVKPLGFTKAVTVTITGSPTRGTFTLSFQKDAGTSPEKTATIKHDATAADVQEQLEKLRSIGSGNVVVGGGPGPNTPFTVTFTGELGGKDIVSLTAAHNFTDGKLPDVAVTPAGNLPWVQDPNVTVAPAGEVRLCTTFADFRRDFGGFSTDEGQRYLAHAVYGFFNNGGTRCYVVRVKAAEDMLDAAKQGSALERLGAIDEIAIVAAPGVPENAVYTALVGHCTTLGDRFAILDGPEVVGSKGKLDSTLLDPADKKNVVPGDSDYAAFYVPWLQVFDPATSIQRPSGPGLVYVPPSGHVAGIYARVDAERGVHKAPANEVVRGALGLRYAVSRAQQGGLNPKGVNVIRDLNGNIRVWGARTVGGDRNGEWKYVNVRRLFLFLRKSIDQGTQWVVFEPNDATLWAKITRNVTAFLTNVWRDGALFGSTPAEAFYVKCDEETNPPEQRDLGQVTCEIGVAVVKPAEFVIFRISQWAGPPG